MTPTWGQRKLLNIRPQGQLQLGKTRVGDWAYGCARFRLLVHVCAWWQTWRTSPVMFVTSLFSKLTRKSCALCGRLSISSQKSPYWRSFAMGKDKMQILSSWVNAGEIYCCLRLQKVLNRLNFVFYLSGAMRVCQHCNGIIKSPFQLAKFSRANSAQWNQEKKGKHLISIDAVLSW